MQTAAMTVPRIYPARKCREAAGTVGQGSEAGCETRGDHIKSHGADRRSIMAVKQKTSLIRRSFAYRACVPLLYTPITARYALIPIPGIGLQKHPHQMIGCFCLFRLRSVHCSTCLEDFSWSSVPSSRYWPRSSHSSSPTTNTGTASQAGGCGRNA